MSHYIRTIHTSFTSGIPSAYPASSAWASSNPYALSSSSAHANILPSIMNKYPPGLGHSASDWRGPSGSNGPGSYNTHSKRRASISLRTPTPISRRPPPPVPSYSRSQPASTTYMKFDPFSDENTFEPIPRPKSTPSPVIYHTPTPRPAATPRSSITSPASIPYTIHIPAASPPLDREARSRLVAGILLNRVHAVGKPMRRRIGVGAEPRAYVKSGLSSVVSVEA
jgi:hypothetical protein